MTNEELFACADLPSLHERTVRELKKSPQDAGSRALFVQLLCMEGDWSRAEAQAEALMKLHPPSAMFCASVSRLIAAERARADVFSGKSSPVWAGERPSFASSLEEAFQAYGKGELSLGAQKTARVLETLPEIPVSFASGWSADWILDGDSRLAGVLEFIRGNSYSLVELASVASLELAKPSHPVDILWPHVRLCLRNGDVLTGHMPGRYPVSSGMEDSALLMARASSWTEEAGRVFLGHGQRCWNTPEGLAPMLVETSLYFKDPVP